MGDYGLGPDLCQIQFTTGCIAFCDRGRFVVAYAYRRANAT